MIVQLSHDGHMTGEGPQVPEAIGIPSEQSSVHILEGVVGVNLGLMKSR